MGATVNTAGLDAFLAGLEAAVDAGEKQGAEYIKDLASQLAPKDEGDLSESGVVEKKPDGGHLVIFGRGLDDERAPAQEFGTIYQEPQPYLVPASAQIDVGLEVAKQVQALAQRSGV